MFLTPGQYKHWLWMVYIQINLFYFQERYCLVTIASLHIDFLIMQMTNKFLLDAILWKTKTNDTTTLHTDVKQTFPSGNL